MKILICRSGCRGQPALARRNPDILHTIGMIHDPVIRFKCARCGLIGVMSASEIARLPSMTEAELKAKNCDVAPGVVVTSPNGSAFLRPDIATVTPIPAIIPPELKDKVRDMDRATRGIVKRNR